MSLHYKISDKYLHLKDYLLDIKTNIDKHTHLIKNARNLVVIVKIKGKKYVVKSFGKPSFPNNYIYGSIRESKARRSYEYSNILLERGINVPEPVAHLEFYKSFALKESFYICRHYDYDLDAREMFENFDPDNPLWNAFLDFTYNLNEKGIDHRDYTKGNILIKKLKKDQFEFTLIDLNRIKFRTMNLSYCVKFLCKITHNPSQLDLIANYYSKRSGLYEGQWVGALHNAVANHENYKARKRYYRKIKKTYSR